MRLGVVVCSPISLSFLIVVEPHPQNTAASAPIIHIKLWILRLKNELIFE